MFIELTESDGKAKRAVPVHLIREIIPMRSGNVIIRMIGNDATANLQVDESPDAIRAALLKAGLLVVVGEEEVTVKEPFRPMNVDWPSVCIRDLLSSYVFWSSEPRDDPNCQCEAIIAEIERRTAKPKRVVRLRMQQTRGGFRAYCGTAIVEFGTRKLDVRDFAEIVVRAIAGPEAEIVWEDAT